MWIFLALLLCNCAQSGNWQLAQEGKSPEVNDEPSFSTWDDVLNGKNPGSQPNQVCANVLHHRTDFLPLPHGILIFQPGF